MVRTVPGADEQLAGLGREQRSIAELCQQFVSVAEISARLNLLLGVTSVLVGDMALDGVVVCTGRRPPTPTPTPLVELLERVLHGLKNIS